MLAVIIATSYAVLTGTGGSPVLPVLESEGLKCLRSLDPCKKKAINRNLHFSLDMVCR
jgi:hypothetical protein